MIAASRTSPSRVRFRHSQRLSHPFLAAVLAGLVLVLGWAGIPAAQAEDGVNPVRIELTALTPSTLGPGDTLSISGTITNTSGADIATPQVLLWRSEAPLLTRQDLDAALVSEQTSPVGSRVIEVPTAYTEDLGEVFAAGASATFTVSASVDVLGFNADGAAYLVGAQMRGVYEGRNQTVGRARTLVPFGNADPVTLTTVVQLDSRPSLIEDGVFVDGHLEEELAAEGRLRQLLSAASGKDVSVLIDPSLLEQVRAMTGKYRVRTDEGLVDGTQQANAKAWLADYQALTGDRWRLPYAQPDFLALTTHEKPKLLKATATAQKSDPDTAKLPLAVVAADGQADRAVVKLAATLDPRALLLSDPATAAPFGESSAAPDATLVNYDPAYLSGGPGPEPLDTALQARQRLLSELFFADAPRSRVVLLDSVPAARAVATLDASWLKRADLDTAIPAQPEPWPGDLDAPPPPGLQSTGPLSAEQLSQAQKLADTYAVIEDLQEDSKAVETVAAKAVAGAISSWWRGMDDDSGRLVAEQVKSLRQQLNGTSVRLSANPQVVMAGRDGQFPISVTNDLKVAVTVQVVFTADNPQRLQIPKIKPFKVGAGESVTLNAAPHASSNGTYAVQAQLETTSGESIGKAKAITVSASNVGKAGWILVIGAGVVFIGGTVLRIRQVRRGESRGGALAGAGPDVTGSTTEVDE